MKITDLIKELQTLLEEQGNIAVVNKYGEEISIDLSLEDHAVEIN